ncbi:MAG: HAD family phosphatase [Pleurocapsa sp. SU_5_0]|nr:HAD family phosphatase [Pleurocapsa sp. SU_5_0]NJO98358.1 HAD family phosphatase [Pleurocapsa sp. CRU_1_2]NJR47673.1 HAD family phosphatase [Hyellaceae cyanobacterium CSU_1_1]
MNLKAVFLDFSGVIINDEAINQELIAELLLSENLRADDDEYTEYCRGKSDRACLKDILANRGRILAAEYLDKLLKIKAQGYRQKIDQLPEIILPTNLTPFLTQLKEQNIAVGLVTGATRSEVEYVLAKVELAQYFDLIVAGDDLEASKPEPEPYLFAASKLNLNPQECLAIENNPIGITSAKRAKIQVVGISNLYPLHMLQRQANWTVDDFLEIELDRVDCVLSRIN